MVGCVLLGDGRQPSPRGGSESGPSLEGPESSFLAPKHGSTALLLRHLMSL